jgi:hypothetical protein
MSGLALDSSFFGLDQSGVGLDDLFAVDPYLSGTTAGGTSIISAVPHVAGEAALVMTAAGSSQPLDATFDASLLRFFVSADTTFSITSTGGTAGASFRAWVQIKSGSTRYSLYVDGIYSEHYVILKAGGEHSSNVAASTLFLVQTSDNLKLNSTATAASSDTPPSTVLTLTIADNISVMAGANSAPGIARAARVGLDISDSIAVAAGGAKMAFSAGLVRSTIEATGDATASLKPAEIFGYARAVRAILDTSADVFFNLRGVLGAGETFRSILSLEKSADLQILSSGADANYIFSNCRFTFNIFIDVNPRLIALEII